MKIVLLFLLLGLALLPLTVSASTSNVCVDVCYYSQTETYDLLIWGSGFDGTPMSSENSDTSQFLATLYSMPHMGEVDIYELFARNPQPELVYQSTFVQARSHREGPLWLHDIILSSYDMPNEPALVLVWHDAHGVYLMPYADMQRTCSADYSVENWLATCGNHPYTVYVVSQESVLALMTPSS